MNQLLKTSQPSNQLKLRRDGLLFLFWLGLGIALRLVNLELKSPWADEWATLVFSLGHSFRSVPLDQILSLETLLQPLQLDPTRTSQDVMQYLMSESTHPPIYFVLTHWWLKLFSPQEGLVNLQIARSLSAVCGAMSIPAIFALSWLTFRSRLSAHLTAALMAVSPYGIYLAQEARHYTLAIIWIIVSLGCFIHGLKLLKRQLTPPWWLVWLWVVVNSLGIATHYFFVLTLLSQVIVLLAFWLVDFRNGVKLYPWQRIYVAILGTLAGTLGWLSVWRTIPNQRVVSWVYHGNPLGQDFFEPLGRTIAWVITMLFLLPIEGVPQPVAILAGTILLLVVFYLVSQAIEILRRQRQQQQSLAIEILGGFILAAIVSMLLVTYILGTDLTWAARYQFVYFPAFILLIGQLLAEFWLFKPQQTFFSLLSTGKTLVVIIILLGFLGSLSVITNFAYQKPDRPDLLVAEMVKAQARVTHATPILVATVHKTHEQTGEMMGIAWEFSRHYRSYQTQFLLAHKEKNAAIATQTLHNSLAQLPRPLQLWLINFSAPKDLAAQNCRLTKYKAKFSGYHYRLYECE